MTGTCWTETTHRTQETHRSVVLKKATPASRRLTLLGGCAVALATWLCLSPPVLADETWNGGTGNWSDATNWDGGNVPTSSDDTTTIGAVGSPAGQVTIDQAGQTAGLVQIGITAASSLTIQGNGSLTTSGTSSNPFVNGTILFGAGTLTVTGPQASLTVHGTDSGSKIGDLILGDSTSAGATNVLVSQGAHVTTDRTWIGEEPTSGINPTGITVRVTGDGTKWDAGTDLFVGGVTGSSATALAIDNRAEMTAGVAWIGYGAAAEVTVTGVDSKLTVGEGGLILGILRFAGGNALGGVGNGTLTIEDGAATTVASDVVVGFGGQGTLNVTDANSSLDLTGGLFVGSNGSDGTVTISNGAQVIAASTVVGADTVTGTAGTLNLDGTPGARGVLLTGGLTKLGGSATVTFNGGILRASVDNPDFISGFDAGEVTIDTGGLFLDTNGFSVVAESGLDGAGALIKQGAGFLFLTGTNTYTGDTTVEAGTLSLGAGGTTGSILGNVVVDNNATLSFFRSDDVVFDGVISGEGGVIQGGTGTTTLTGVSGYTGPTEVAVGTLVVGDSATPTATITSDVTVDNGATLAGFGTVGAIINNGRVVPGDLDGNIGTLHATGNYTQSAGARLDINVTPPVASRVAVIGNARLAGLVDFTYATGTYGPGIYPIVTTTGGVTGTFGSVAEDGNIPLNLLRSVVYTPTNANLVLTLPADAIDDADTSVFSDVSDTALRNTQYITSLLLGDAAATDDAMTKCTSRNQTCFWIDPLAHFADFDNNGDSFNAETGGFLAGVQRQMSDDILLGIAAGYDYTSIDAGKSDGTIQTARVFAYSKVDLSPVVLSGTVGYAHDWIDTDRDSGDFVGIGTAHQSNHASEIAAGLQVAMPVTAGGFKLKPKIGLQYALLDESSFDEDGAQLLNLHGNPRNQNSLRSTIGFGVSREFPLTDVTLVPHLDIAYARELLANSSMQVSLDDGTDLHADNPFRARDIITLGAGVDLFSTSGFGFSADYAAQIYGADGVDHTVRLQGRWTF